MKNARFLLFPAVVLALIAFGGCWETDVKGTAGAACKKDEQCRGGMVCKTCGCYPADQECPVPAGDAAGEGGETSADGGGDVPADTTDSATAPDTADSAPIDATDATDASDASSDG